MHRRIRALCLTAGGLLAAAAPLLIAEPAGASTTYDSNQASLTFINYDGVGVTCAMTEYTAHNTDDPNQPFITVDEGISGPTECTSSTYLDIKLTYKDKSGVTRYSEGSGRNFVSLKVTGTYSPITATLFAYFYNCDPARSATCELTVTVSPK